MRGLPDNGALNDALALAKQQLFDCYRTYRAQGVLLSTEALRVAVVGTGRDSGSERRAASLAHTILDRPAAGKAGKLET